MIPSSFCTIATVQCKQELAGFLFSLSIHHPNARVYIMCDTPTKKYIQSGYIPNLVLIWDITLDTYSQYTRYEMEKQGIWSEFQMSKATIIEKVLQIEPDTLFLDSDIIILDTIHIKNEYELGVSPGFVNSSIIEKYGYYNGGMLWTNQKSLPEKWRKYTKISRYYDQASIEDLCIDYKYFEFDDNYNLQTWRFICGEDSTEKIMSYITIKKNNIMYRNKPLKFIHTHFNMDSFKQINNYFINLLETAKYYRELLCIYYVIHSKWHFKLSNKSTPWNELVLLMSKKTDIEYEVGYNEDMQLYPIIFSDKIKVMNKIIKMVVPTKPVLLEKNLCCLAYEERTHELFYPGKTIKETYENMSKSKYGVGNMVELMAFGTVPIVKECVEHEYYVLENSPPLKEEEWTLLSRKCHLWYINNRHSSNILYPIIDRIFEQNQ